MTLRWWLFVGVAHETQRMIYEPPLVRLGRVMRTAIDAYADMARTIAEQITPVMQQVGTAFTQLARALGGQPPR